MLIVTAEHTFTIQTPATQVQNQQGAPAKRARAAYSRFLFYYPVVRHQVSLDVHFSMEERKIKIRPASHCKYLLSPRLYVMHQANQFARTPCDNAEP